MAPSGSLHGVTVTSIVSSVPSGSATSRSTAAPASSPGSTAPASGSVRPTSSTITLVGTRTATNFPLTTIFTPPSWCTNVYYTFSAATSGISTFARTDLNGSYASCFPPWYAYQQMPNITAQYFPGVCPGGYEALSSTANAQRGPATTSWCCPSGFALGQGFGCYSTVTTPTLVMLNSASSTAIETPWIAVDYYIQVAWASSQLDSFTPLSAPLLQAEATSIANASSPSSSSMSGREIAGISIGLPFAVAVIAIACYAIWRRKRRPRGTQSLTDYSESDYASTINANATSDRNATTNVNTNATEAERKLTHDYPHSDSAHLRTPEVTQVTQVTHVGAQRIPTTAGSSQDGQTFTFNTYERPSWQIDETEPATEPR